MQECPLDLRSTTLSMGRKGDAGMLGVDKIGKMRRAHFREDHSIKGISRDLGISRTMVQMALRSRATSFRYERRRSRVRRSVLGSRIWM